MTYLTDKERDEIFRRWLNTKGADIINIIIWTEEMVKEKGEKNLPTP